MASDSARSAWWASRMTSSRGTRVRRVEQGPAVGLEPHAQGGNGVPHLGRSRRGTAPPRTSARLRPRPRRTPCGAGRHPDRSSERADVVERARGQTERQGGWPLRVEQPGVEVGKQVQQVVRVPVGHHHGIHIEEPHGELQVGHGPRSEVDPRRCTPRGKEVAGAALLRPRATCRGRRGRPAPRSGAPHRVQQDRRAPCELGPQEAPRQVGELHRASPEVSNRWTGGSGSARSPPEPGRRRRRWRSRPRTTAGGRPAHDVLEQPGEQRIVRAPQDQRVDVVGPERREIGAARWPRSSSLVVSPRSTNSTKAGAGRRDHVDVLAGSSARARSVGAGPGWWPPSRSARPVRSGWPGWPPGRPDRPPHAPARGRSRLTSSRAATAVAVLHATDDELHVAIDQVLGDPSAKPRISSSARGP